jgi:ubiquinone/menaquinone biosynthesis C-methylase UbiE
MEYWENYYNDDNIIGSKDFQKNIGRTKSGITIKKEIWKKTLNDIETLLSLNATTSEVLELCCGNGQIIGEIASKCKNATGVDYSKKLLVQLKSNYGNSVKTIHSNVLKASFKKESFHIIIIYFALQHFTEKETVRLIQKAVGWLKKGGKIYLGDIPNEVKKWEYINKPEYKKDYIQRVIDNRPMIGNWFHPDFFLAIGSFFNDKKIDVKIIKQPDYQINSDNRFDVLIKKN